MKNYYDLTTQEKDKYRDEFNKLNFTKRINKSTRVPSLIAAIVCSLLFGFFSEDATKPDWIYWILAIGIYAIISFIVSSICLNIACVRWMKIKHNIEY